jgi:MlaD protein
MDPRRGPPYKTVGLVTILVMGLIGLVLYSEFRGDLTPRTKLTMVATRAGLVMDPGSKVTYNGVEIGRVSGISEINRDGKPAAQVVLDVTPKYVNMIPVNAAAEVKATTVFGNKYVALSSPKNAAPQLITPSTMIDASTAPKSFARSATSMTSRPKSITRWAITATRWVPTPRAPLRAPPTRTPTRRTCHGPTPGVDLAGGRGAGSRSPANSGLLPISSWTPARAWPHTTTLRWVRRLS